MATNNAINANQTLATGSSPTFNGLTLTTGTVSSAPSTGNDIVNKTYADSLIVGLNWQAAAVVATTANLTATYANGAAGVGATLTNSGVQAAFSSDGVTPAINSRVLVQFQTATEENGIYTLTTVGTGATNWVLARATDFDTPAEIQPGDIVPVQSGTLYGNTTWLQTATVVTIGTDPIVFSQFSYNIQPLNKGGTSANLTASNGGIFYSTATAGAILSGTATAGQMLRSGASTAPTWSTATFPATATNTARILRADGTNWVESTSTFADTYAASGFLYANGANNVAGLATANNGLPVTGNTGVPAVLAGPGTTGNLLQSNTSAAPTWSTTTYPSTNAINTMLYASSANVMGVIAAAASSVLVTSAGSVPSLQTSLPTSFYADKANQESGTSLITSVNPAVQQYHPSACKLWGFVTTSAGTPTLVAAYNLTSLTDGGVGVFTVNIDVDFSSAAYSINCAINKNDAANSAFIIYYTQAAGSFILNTSDFNGVTTDPTSFSFGAFGDQ